LDAVNAHSVLSPIDLAPDVPESKALESHSPRKAASPKLTAAYIGVFLFSLVYFARPEDWIPGTKALPFAKVTGFLAIGAFLLGLLGHARINRSKATWLLLALFGQLCLAIPFSTYKGGSFETVIYGFSKIVLIVLALMVVANTLPRLRLLIFVQTVAVIAVSVVSLIDKTLLAGRVTGALDGIFGNPNDLASNISLVLPFCFAFLLKTRTMFKKAFWLCAILILCYTVVVTLSRGGFLGTLAAIMSSLWYIGLKVRRSRLPFLLLPLIICVGVLVSVGSNYSARIQSIVDPKLDKTGSSVARQDLLLQSLELAAKHPLVGIGPGQFSERAGWHDTHNSYAGLAAEAGILASIFFIWMFVNNFGGVRRIVLNRENGPDIRLFAGALAAGLIAFFVTAFFSNLEYQFLPYFLVGYSSALSAIAPQQTRSVVPEQRYSIRAAKALQGRPCVG
jgi:O-Antigen ligase